MELEITKMRHSDPEGTFALLAQLGKGIAEQVEEGIDAVR